MRPVQVWLRLSGLPQQEGRRTLTGRLAIERTVAGMTELSLPTYDRLGPDPEPRGARADRLIEAAAVAPRRSAASPVRLVRSRSAIAAGVRAQILMARLDITTTRVSVGDRS